MLSLQNVSSAAQAQTYFSKDNYYTQDENADHSAWFGKGAATLGLSGQVQPAAFMNLLEGRAGEQQLGKWITDEATGERRQDHQPGIDLTFSAPKSVSLLAEVAGDAGVRNAHEAAVQAALAYLEENVIRARVTRGGVTSIEHTGNLVAALFRHNTSRDLDPQTHTHAVIMNATLREDGQWRSIDNRELYETQKLVGAIYNAELASGLQALGYRLTNPDRKGNFEIEGIPREQIEHFSQRREAIKDALGKRNLDVDTATAGEKEKATLATRQRKVDVDHAQLLDGWRERAAAQGLDLDGLRTAAAERRALGIQSGARLTGRQALSFAAAHLVEREAVVKHDDLVSTAITHGTGRVSPIEVMKAFAVLEKNGDLVALPDKQYTTRKMMQSERWALDFVKLQKEQAPIVLDQAAVASRIAAAEKQQAFAYSVGQREAIALSLTSPDRFVAIQGLAGTGKTTMLKTLNDIAATEGYVVRGMAPTGAAAKVMIKETGIAAETVAMFQIKERQLQTDIEFAKQYAPDFERRPELWVVDESSFLAQRQMAQLLRMAEKANAKVVYLGDRLQLQGVEAGKPFELAQKDGIDTAYMTDINRQKTPVMKQAVDILTGRNTLDAGARLTQIELKQNAQSFDYLTSRGKVVQTDDVVGVAVTRVLALSPADRERSITITPFNEDRVAINNGVRDGLKKRGELSSDESQHEILVSKGFTRAQIKEAQYYQAGDVVRFNRDYLQINVDKGDYARVTAVDHGQGIVTLAKKNGKTLNWEPAKHNKVEVYDPEDRDLSKGDLIRLTRNDTTFRNGEIARVVGLEGTLARLEVNDRGTISHHDVDLASSQHWDHAYASTIHAAQGASKGLVHFAIDLNDLSESKNPEKDLQQLAKVFGDRAYYVGMTRASHELVIVTNDIDNTRKAIVNPQDKTTVTEAMKQEIQKPPVHRESQRY